MLSGQQDSGGLSCLPSPRAADTVPVLSSVALRDSFFSSSNTSDSSSALSFPAAAVATPTALSFQLKSNHQSNSIVATSDTSASLQRAASGAVNVPLQRCAAAATASAASPLQPTAVGVSPAAAFPSSSSSGASPAPYSAVSSSDYPQISTRAPCPTPPSTSSGGSLGPSGYTLDYYTAADFDVRANFEAAAPPADYGAAPPSEYHTASAYTSASGPKYSPALAADYKTAVVNAYTGAAATDYGPAAAAAKFGPASVPSAAEFRNAPQQPQLRHCQEVWQHQDQRLPDPPCQPYERGAHASEQQLFLTQPEPRKLQSQLTPERGRLPQLQRQQHFEQFPSVHQQQYNSLQKKQQASQVQPLEQRNTKQTGQQGPYLQRASEGTVDLATSTVAVDVPERGDSSDKAMFESRCTPQRQSTSSTACLYASQTTASSLSASCGSAQSYSASGSPPTHAQQPCDNSYSRTPVNNYDASTAASDPAACAPLTAAGTAAALTAPDGWSSLQPSPRCFSTFDAQNLSKPARAAGPAATAASSVHDCNDAPAAQCMLSTPTPSSRACTPVTPARAETTTVVASTITVVGAPAFSSGGAPDGAAASPMTDCAPTRQTADCISFDEAALYQSAPSRSFSSGVTANTSFEEQQQWQQTSVSFLAGQSTFIGSPASSAAAATQSLLSQQQLQPLLQQTQQQRPQQQQRGQSPRQQNLHDPAQPQRLLQVQQQQQYQYRQQQLPLQPRQRLQAHQPLQQQQQLHQKSPPPVTVQPLQHVHQPQYVQQDDLQARQQLQQQHVQQPQQQPQSSQRVLYEPHDLHPQSLHQRQLGHHLQKQHPLQQQQLDPQQRYLQSQQLNGSHYVPQAQQASNTHATGVPYSCSPRQVSSLPLATGTVTPPQQPVASVMSPTYNAASTSPLEGNSSRSDSSNPSSSSVPQPPPHTEIRTSSPYVQSQQPSQQQRFSQIQQQQLLQFQLQREQLEEQGQPLQQQQHQLVAGQSGVVGLPSSNCSMSGVAPVAKRQQHQQQHQQCAGHQAVRPDPPNQQDHFDTQQQYQRDQQHQQLNPDNLSPSPTTFFQEPSRVESTHGQLSVPSSPKYLVPSALSSGPAGYTPSSTASPSCVNRPSTAAPAASIRSTTFSYVSGDCLSSSRPATRLAADATQPSAPPTLLSCGSRSAAIPTAVAAVQTEGVVAAAGTNSAAVCGAALGAAAASPSFNAPFPGYATSTAADVEPPLDRHAPPNVSRTSGRAVSPACFFPAAAGRAPDYMDFRRSGDVNHANAACCIPVCCSSQTDNWGSGEGTCSSTSTTKGGTKRGATPQQKGSSRRCPQYRQQQHLGTESAAAANTNTHPLRAVRGLPIQQRKLFRNLARQTPRVQGLTFDHNQIRWISYWKNNQGKQIQRHFPVSRFGFIEARRLALEERNRILGWPLDTDEAADAIAELSRTAEQSLQLLLQQSLATGGGHHGEGAAAITQGKAADVLESTRAVGTRAAAAVTGAPPAEAVPGAETATTTAERCRARGGGGGDVCVGRAQDAHLTKAYGAAVSAATTTEQQQPLRPAPAAGAATGAGYFAGAEEAFPHRRGMDADVPSATATAATPTTAAPTAATATGTQPTKGNTTPVSKKERRPPAAGEEQSSVREATHLCYVAAEGGYSTQTYHLREEAAEEALEKREAPLQFQQQHRTSVISASTTDQERTREMSASQITSQAAVDPASNYAAGDHTSAYSAAAAAEAENTGAASSTFDEAFMQQRDRSAASTNVEEDAEAAVSVVGDNLQPTKQQHQEQQKWLQCYEGPQQHVLSAEQAYDVTNNRHLGPRLDLLQQQRSQQQQQQYTPQAQQHQSQPGEGLQQQEWAIQKQPPQQSELHKSASQGKGMGCISSDNISCDSDSLDITTTMEESGVIAGEGQSQEPYDSPPQRGTENSYGATSSSIHQQNQDQEYFRPHGPSPSQREQQLPRITQQQQTPAENSDLLEAPVSWQGHERSQQMMFVTQGSPALCSATVAAKSLVPAPVSSVPAAGRPPGFESASGFTAAPALMASSAATAPATGGGAATTVCAAVSAVASVYSAAPTPVCSKQQPRQRSRCRKKKSDVAFICSDVQQSATTASPAATAPEPTSATAPIATQAPLPGALPSITVQNIALQTSTTAEGARVETAAGETRVDTAAAADTQSTLSVGSKFPADSSPLVATTAATSISLQMQQGQLQNSTFFNNFSNSQSGGCTAGVAAAHPQQNLTSTPNTTSNGGIFSSVKTNHSHQLQQQCATYNSQTLSWSDTSDASCRNSKSQPYQEQDQQPGVQQDHQRATQGTSTAAEGQNLLQQQTEHLSIIAKPCMSPRQPQGRQKHQRASSKKKPVMQGRSAASSLCATAEEEGATAAAATAAVAAAAATAVVAAATATAAAAVSSASASLKRKKSPERGGDQKKLQSSSSSRKARRKCKPEEQQHALFSAAAAAARQAVDTLPEPIIHPHLLQRHFPPPLQCVQSSLQHLQQQQVAQPQQPQQQQHVEQRQQEDQQSVLQLGHKESNDLPSHDAALPALDKGQQQVSQGRMYCQQQPQRVPELQRTRLPAAPLRSTDNECSSLVPTPPQTPSCAAPFEYPPEGSRSDSYYRNDSSSCYISTETASRSHLSSSTTSSSSSSNSTSTDSNTHSNSISNRNIDSSSHSTADSSIHSSVGGRISTNSINDASSDRGGAQIGGSYLGYYVDKGELPSRKPLPLCSSCCSSGSSDKCSTCNSGTGRSCSSEDWFGTQAPEALLHAENSNSKTECSPPSVATRSFQTAAAEDVTTKARILAGKSTDAAVETVAPAMLEQSTAASGKTAPTTDTTPQKDCGKTPHPSNCNSNSGSTTQSDFFVLQATRKESDTNVALLDPPHCCPPAPPTSNSEEVSSSIAAERDQPLEREAGDASQSKQREGPRRQQPQDTAAEATQARTAPTAEGQQTQQQLELPQRRLFYKKDMQQRHKDEGRRTEQNANVETLRREDIVLPGANATADENGTTAEQCTEEKMHESPRLFVQGCTNSGSSQQERKCTSADFLMTRVTTGGRGEGGSTQDVCNNTDPMCSRSACSRDSVWSGSAVSSPFLTQHAPAVGFETTGTAGQNPPRDSLPMVPSHSADPKCTDSSSAIPASSSVRASDFLSASCWLGGGISACSAAASADNERCSRPCGQQQQQQNPTVSTQTNTTAIERRQTEATACQSEELEITEQPIIDTLCADHLQTGSCTPHKDQHACSSCVDGLPGCADGLSSTDSVIFTPRAVEASSVASSVTQQTQEKQSEAPLPQHFRPGGDRRRDFVCGSPAKEPLGCHCGEGAGLEENTEQQLLQRRSPCDSSSAAIAGEKEPRLSFLSAKMQCYTPLRQEQQQKQGQQPQHEQPQLQGQQRQEQQHEEQQHVTPQLVPQQPQEAEASLFPALSQTNDAVHTSSLLVNSRLLSCESSSELNPYASDSTEPLLSPFAAQPRSPTDRRSSSGCSTTKEHFRPSKGCWEGLHKDKVQQDKQTGAELPPAAATITAAASSLPAAPTPPSAADDPSLQGYLHAPGDFFQLLPSPRRPSSDWLACESNSFPILQPRCSRSSLISHAATAAAASLTSPSSASSSVSTGSTAAVTANETYAFPAGSATAVTAAAARTAAAATNSSATAGPSTAATISATTATGEGGSSLIRSLAPASPSEQQQHTVSASCSLMLLGARSYLTPAAPDLNSVSAAVQHQQQLSPLWTATVPLPALFRSSSSSNIDSFPSLPPAASGGRRCAAAAVGAPTGAAVADSVGGIDAVAEFGGSSSSVNSRPCASLNNRPKETISHRQTFPAAAAGAVQTDPDSEIGGKSAAEHFWRKLLPAGDSKDASAAEDADDRYDCRSTAAAETVVRHGGASPEDSSSCSRNCSAGLPSPATAALRRTSHHLSSGILLRLCTSASDPLLRSPSGGRANRPTTAPGAAPAAPLPAAALNYPSTSTAETRPATADELSVATITAVGETTGHQRQKVNKSGESALTMFFGMEASEGTEEGQGRLSAAADGYSEGTAHAPRLVGEKVKVTAALRVTAESAATPEETAAGGDRTTDFTEGRERTTGVLMRERVRSPVHVASGGAVWRSTTATSDAAHATEEGSSFFDSNTGNWLLSEKLGCCLALSLNADSENSNGKAQQDVHRSPAVRAAASTVAVGVRDCSAHKSQGSSICCGKPPTATATARKEAAAASSCPVSAAAESEDSPSNTASAAAGRQRTCFTPKQLLLSSPLFAAREGSSDEVLQPRDNSLPPVAGAAPWRAAAAAASWTSASAGEEGWSPLLSFAAVPPSPIDAPGRFLRISSPRYSVLAPLPATAATTCSSSSTTEADAGAPFSFLLSERALSALNSSENAGRTSEKDPQRQLPTEP